MDLVYKRELLSALQKGIRRDETSLALNCAKELDINNYEIWSKLEVYSAEDIGRACPWIASYVYDMKQKYFNETDIWERRGILLNVVYYLCKQNKSRIADNIVHAYFLKVLPQFGSNKCVEELKELFLRFIYENDTDGALQVAAHLYNHGEEQFMIESMAEIDDMETKALITQFQDANNKTRYNFDLLFLVNIILHQTMHVENLPIVKSKDIKELSQAEVREIYNNGKVESFADWVYDKHTEKGRDLGRGMKHFYDVSAKLINCYLDDPYEKLARKNNDAFF